MQSVSPGTESNPWTGRFLSYMRPVRPLHRPFCMHTLQSIAHQYSGNRTPCKVSTQGARWSCRPAGTLSRTLSGRLSRTLQYTLFTPHSGICLFVLRFAWTHEPGINIMSNISAGITWTGTNLLHMCPGQRVRHCCLALMSECQHVLGRCSSPVHPAAAAPLSWSIYPHLLLWQSRVHVCACVRAVSSSCSQRTGVERNGARPGLVFLLLGVLTHTGVCPMPRIAPGTWHVQGESLCGGGRVGRWPQVAGFKEGKPVSFLRSL